MAAFTYEYRTPGLYKTPAQAVGEICEGLANSAEGLSPATLLDASRDEAAPLHREFEWNNDVAAEKYRLGQARGMIQNLRIVVTREDGTQDRERSFVVTQERKSNYVPLLAALTNDEWKRGLLKQAQSDAETFMAKYRRLTELSEVIAAMGSFLDGNGA